MLNLLDSPWTTEELVAQAIEEQAISAKAGANVLKAGNIAGQTPRTWVAWKLSDWRLTWRRPYLRHPSEGE